MSGFGLGGFVDGYQASAASRVNQQNADTAKGQLDFSTDQAKQKTITGLVNSGLKEIGSLIQAGARKDSPAIVNNVKQLQKLAGNLPGGAGEALSRNIELFVQSSRSAAEEGQVAGTKTGAAATTHANTVAQGVTEENKPILQAQGELPKPEGGAKPLGSVGKNIYDRNLFVDEFGSNSAEVAAFDRAVKAESAPEPPKFSDITSLRKDFQSLTKDTRDLASAAKKVFSASDTAVGGISLVFGFMKAVDPRSTVREGEQATARNATGIPGRIRNLYNLALNGKGLNETQAQEFKDEVRLMMESQAPEYEERVAQYRRIADRAGINPDDIIVPIDFEEKSDKPGTAPKRMKYNPETGALDVVPSDGELDKRPEFSYR